MILRLFGGLKRHCVVKHYVRHLKVAQNFVFAERRLLLAAEPFAIMCAYLISTDLYRGRHVPVCREPVHIRGNSARLFYRPESI